MVYKSWWVDPNQLFIMFKDRNDAGIKLAEKLKTELNELSGVETVVLAIPRGGVVVGTEIAKSLKLPLDIIITKKLGAPDRPELAIGAIGQTQGSLFLDQRIIKELNIDRLYVDLEIIKKQTEINRRENLYRQGKPEIELNNKRVILVDDGAATGATMIASAREVWNREPKQVIIALPVCAKHTLAQLEKEADMVIVLEIPDDFYAVGQFYTKFEQVRDEEVIKILCNNVIARPD